MFYLILAAYLLIKIVLAVLPIIEDWEAARHERCYEKHRRTFDRRQDPTSKPDPKKHRNTAALDALDQFVPTDSLLVKTNSDLKEAS